MLVRRLLSNGSGVPLDLNQGTVASQYSFYRSGAQVRTGGALPGLLTLGVLASGVGWEQVLVHPHSTPTITHPTE